VQRRFRNKLFLIAGASVFAVLLLIAVGIVTGARVDQQIGSIEARYVPMLELGPQVESAFDRVRRQMQDAVAAQDKESLAATQIAKARLMALLDEARPIMTGSDATAVRIAVEEYYATALAVSSRLIAGETGEPIVEAIAHMQAVQSHAEEELKRTTTFDRSRLTAGFESLRQANKDADWVQLAIALICAPSVILLSLWVSRRVMSSLEELSAGFARFGDGDFSQPMRVMSRDELGAAAKSANQMAEKLRQADAQRRAADWIRNGQAGLQEELQGELEFAEVARRSLRFLARYIRAGAGALYAMADDRLELVADYAGGAAGELSPERL